MSRLIVLVPIVILFAAPTLGVAQIEFGTPIELTSNLTPSTPDEEQRESVDRLGVNYALAGNEAGFLAIWTEARTIFGLMLSPEGEFRMGPFVVHEGERLYSLTALSIGDRYLVAAADVVEGLILTRLVVIAPDGSIDSSFEYGSGGEECAPSQIAAKNSATVFIACEDERIVEIDLETNTGEHFMWSGDGSFENGPATLACAEGECLTIAAYGPGTPPQDRNIGLLDLADPTGDLRMIGYRDANLSTIASTHGDQGLLIVTRSFFDPPGAHPDHGGVNRDSLHGFFVDEAGEQPLPPFEGAAQGRLPRIVANGDSFLLGFRTVTGDTRTMHLGPRGEPLGGVTSLSEERTLGVQLAVGAGLYASIHDLGSTLLFRGETRATSLEDVSGGEDISAQRDGGTEVDAEAPSTSAAGRSGGCGCGVAPTEGHGMWALLIATWWIRRSRWIHRSRSQ